MLRTRIITAAILLAIIAVVLFVLPPALTEPPQSRLDGLPDIGHMPRWACTAQRDECGFPLEPLPLVQNLV